MKKVLPSPHFARYNEEIVRTVPSHIHLSGKRSVLSLMPNTQVPGLHPLTLDYRGVSQCRACRQVILSRIIFDHKVEKFPTKPYLIGSATRIVSFLRMGAVSAGLFAVLFQKECCVDLVLSLTQNPTRGLLGTLYERNMHVCPSDVSSALNEY